jgi:hypothetical protein
MVCVLVPLLLKRNIGVLLGVLRGPRSDAAIFFPCYASAIILWTYTYIFSLYFCNPEFI